MHRHPSISLSEPQGISKPKRLYDIKLMTKETILSGLLQSNSSILNKQPANSNSTESLQSLEQLVELKDQPKEEYQEKKANVKILLQKYQSNPFFKKKIHHELNSLQKSYLSASTSLKERPQMIFDDKGRKNDSIRFKEFRKSQNQKSKLIYQKWSVLLDRCPESHSLGLVHLR